MAESSGIEFAPGSADPQTEPAPTIAVALRSASDALRQAGIEMPMLDARLLLAEALGVPASAIHSQASGLVSPEAATRFADCQVRRMAGEPVHRIIGRRAFYRHEFALSPGTLEPRPDTETLVEVASTEMQRILRSQASLAFADLGVGTGAIVVSLLALYPQATAVGVDISPDALATSLCNAESAGVADRLQLLACDYCAGIAGPLDLVVSNPPYIRSGEIKNLSREVREHDPIAALDGGPDGLDAYRSIASGVGPILNSNGAIILEIGLGQAADVAAIFSQAGFSLEAQKADLNGIVRVLTFRA